MYLHKEFQLNSVKNSFIKQTISWHLRAFLLDQEKMFKYLYTSVWSFDRIFWQIHLLSQKIHQKNFVNMVENKS